MPCVSPFWSAARIAALVFFFFFLRAAMRRLSRAGHFSAKEEKYQSGDSRRTPNWLDRKDVTTLTKRRLARKSLTDAETLLTGAFPARPCRRADRGRYRRAA